MVNLRQRESHWLIVSLSYCCKVVIISFKKLLITFIFVNRIDEQFVYKPFDLEMWLHAGVKGKCTSLEQ